MDSPEENVQNIVDQVKNFSEMDVTLALFNAAARLIHSTKTPEEKDARYSLRRVLVEASLWYAIKDQGEEQTVKDVINTGKIRRAFRNIN